MGGRATDETGFYFIYFGDFSSAFGTTWWLVSAPGYQSLFFMTRRESLVGIRDYTLKPDHLIVRERPRPPREP